MVEFGAKSQSYNQKRALWSGILLGRASSRALDAWSIGAWITKLGAERPARCLLERDRVQHLVCVSPSRTLHISLCLCMPLLSFCLRLFLYCTFSSSFQLHFGQGFQHADVCLALTTSQWRLGRSVLRSCFHSTRPWCLVMRSGAGLCQPDRL